MKFKVKKQILPIFLMHLIFITLAVMLVLLLRKDKIFLYLLFADAGLYVIYLTSIMSCSCRVKKNYLYYNSGIFFYRINIDKIIRIEQCKNLYLSLAPSRDRIRIIYGNPAKPKMKYISVEDNDNLVEFIKHKGYEKL